MATKPNKYPEHAVNLEVDPQTSAVNKVEPPQEWKNSGEKKDQPFPRPWMNYILNLIYKWIVYFDEKLDEIVTDTAQPTLEAVYPVGTYYTSSSPTDPATLFGFGTWTRIKGRFVVGLDEGNSKFDGVGEQGGAETHTHGDNFSVNGHALTEQEMPAHNHGVPEGRTNGEGGTSGGRYTSGDDTTNVAYNFSTSQSKGGGQEHTHGLSGSVSASSNLPPYHVAYVWRRDS